MHAAADSGCNETAQLMCERSNHGFLGRVIHGTNPRAWLKEVNQRIGEKIDFAVATGE